MESTAKVLGRPDGQSGRPAIRFCFATQLPILAIPAIMAISNYPPSHHHPKLA